jgi:hypothetical protein
MRIKSEPERDINELIKYCNFDSLPNLLKNRKICLNNIMKAELERRMYDKNDKCMATFCRNCCYIHYGNTSCNNC